MANDIDKIQRFTDLNAWKEAHKLSLIIYKLTANFPAEERYSLIDQMRRAAVSVTSNISEGFSRNSANEKRRFYSMAKGSNMELQNQLILSKDLGYLDGDEFKKAFEQSVNVNKLISGLFKAAEKLDHNK
ncbi:MAG: four helix bundle protein [Candidatus Colwellbacteria bacterium]|nr:four helix bundle protein [Candidatus Colwellbacteria bacterium]